MGLLDFGGEFNMPLLLAGLGMVGGASVPESLGLLMNMQSAQADKEDRAFRRQQAEREQKRQDAGEAARSRLMGGYDPQTEIQWNTGRQGMTQQERQAAAMQAFPEAAGQAVMRDLFPKPMSLNERYASVSGVGLVDLAGQDGPRVAIAQPQKPKDPYMPSSAKDLQYWFGVLEKAKPGSTTAQFAQTQIDKISGPGGSGDLSKNPTYYVRADGSLGIGQLGADGKFHEVQLPEGARPAPANMMAVDAGTSTALLDPRTGAQVGGVAKDLAGEQRLTAQGKAEGERIANAPKAAQQAEQMIASIDSVLGDPNFSRGVGMSSVFNIIPGTAGYDFQAKANQLQGQAFLQAFESLKGGGQITEVEGKKAEQAIARLDTAQSETAYRDALTELRSILSAAVRRNENLQRGQQPPRGVPMVDGSDLFQKYGLER